jgi:ABC-type uncharacterized transport system substrate-binding protein
MIRIGFLVGLLGLFGMVSCSGDPGDFKILYVNSYHPGYPSSDDITEGLREMVQKPGILLKILYMDTKRNQDEEFIRKKSESILKEMEAFGPDLLIVSDDNAVKYLVVPYLLDQRIPIVFCGVNWTAAPYRLPHDHITGMIEVLPVDEGIRFIKGMRPGISRVMILSENSVSEHKNIGFITPILENMGFIVDYRLAGTFDEWKPFFILANERADVIYMPTNGAIRGWKNEEAIQFIRENIKIPTVTCDDFMMPYAVLGVTKVQKEQGIWAGETALKIRKGYRISQIEITKNSEIRIWWNPGLAEIIHLMPDRAWLKDVNLFEY